MLKNLWYVVAASTDLRDALLPVTLLGHRFVAFRDTEGRARLLSDICVHRGASLAAGQRVNGEVQCPYHGWRYGGDGVCTHIPAQPQARIPARARVDGYPVVERHGWIWAFLGDLPEAERPPLPPLAWADDANVRVIHGTFDWDANWERIVENGLDFAHAPFVHGTSFGAPDRPEIDAFEVSAPDAWSGHAKLVMQRPVRRGLLRRQATGEHVEVVTQTGFHLSGPCATLELQLGNGWRIDIVSAHVPVDALHTRTYWMMGRTFLKTPLLDARFRARNLRIFNEDHAVLRRVRPECVPDGWQSEVSVKSDALQIAFRQRVRALEQRGWLAAPPGSGEAASEVENRLENKRAINVIACPARRDVSTWALDGALTPVIPIASVSDANAAN
ncbi:aromatic ring-hydroxylating dioxygenase subunit alpha [Paraburkholderia tropica]|uniref:Phenylpropionate dioxygenase-like ring-hydroxylating dioxygenase large terminal subunit n=1 Tax=Paraburkholderia tropica TaxID=92647 RepID=A0ABX5MS50_9BURK|nr:aromatic ring-hydroxylating dioxygenase subunit alpha [Paraburkholderia tropica]MDE1140175.1 aromatic ring-hydroxylating dioxygenase subunit alpha [Paraburkholderia tropica]PXX18101.1 phenylpropionate dioxygenase-like ring-hydroxylating dioxygenase large terminal subunit [Paraburkholderia tropica]PZW86083.1 phenylpropionate dioxygenase-like ring-hydroxylating dioxygenase large terminal subunit [Paraburkholderia tropica]